MKKKEFKNFREFYPHYLSEHDNKTNRRLHFAGCVMVIMILLYTLISQNWTILILIPIVGYGIAWTGHFFFEKNKPATFRYPVYSLMGDWLMFIDIIRGKVKL